VARSYVLFGRNIFEEALNAGATVTDIFCENEAAFKWAQERAHGLRTKAKWHRALPKEVRDTSHQGLAFRVEHDFYLSSAPKDYSVYPRILLCNHLEDVQNLGAIIRSAAAFGFGLVVHESRRSVSLNPVAVKISAGQAFRLDFLEVPNLLKVVQEMIEEGFQVAALAKTAEAVALYQFNPHPLVGLIVGSESEGVSRTLLKQSASHLWIPMTEGVESLNAVQAASIAMSWIHSQTLAVNEKIG
jgi:23S rRNA (guanosine2251-2'-O)-methyltransferase